MENSLWKSLWNVLRQSKELMNVVDCLANWHNPVLISDKFDFHMSVYRNITSIYSQREATFLDLFIAVHVSGGSSSHHQGHITVHTASGIVNQ